MSDDMKEIMESFTAETEDHIQKATECLLSLERGVDEESINCLFRAFHTIKGNSRMLGFDNVGTIAHSAENVIARLRNGSLKPSKQVVDLFLSTLDLIGAIVMDAAEGTATAPSGDALIRALDAVAAGTVSPQNVLIAEPVILATTALAAPAGHPPTKPIATMDTAEIPVPRTKKVSVLVVEDDFITRKTLVSLLKDYGECDIAFDGKEAIAAFAGALNDHPYDLVCMDIMLPEMDGFEAARQIRSVEMVDAIQKLKVSGARAPSFNRRDTIIVMTSSLDDPESYINACYRCGANAYLVKPIDAATLKATLLRFSLI